MPGSGEMLVKQYERIANLRGQWENTWQDIADNILGRKDFTSEDITGGRKRMQRIFDTTALFSVGALAGGLHSLLVNPAAEWFKLKPEDDRLLDDYEVALWFEDAEKVMYNSFNRPEARFASQNHELLTEIVAFGTGGYFIEDVRGLGPMFSARPLSELYIAENQQGVVDTIFRLFRYTSRQAVERWGDKAPEAAKKDMASGNSENQRKYLHMVRPADSPMPMPFRPNGFPYESAFIGLDDKDLISTGGYHEMPYMVPRWEKDPGESYGRGPGFVALADAKMLNEMKKTLLQAGVVKVRPPTMTEDGESQVSLKPGANNVVRPGRMNPPIQPIDVGGDLGWGVELLQDTRHQVQQAFHWQLLELIRDPNMTATQVMEISHNVMRLLSPVLGRFHSELLEPAIERTFAINARRGMFLPPPPAIAGRPIKVEYVSPVARAQKEGDARAIVDLFTVGANFAQIDPSVLDVLNPDEAMRQLGSNKGVPPSVLRSQEEVSALREARAEEQARVQTIEEASQLAETTAKVAPVLQQAATG